MLRLADMKSHIIAIINTFICSYIITTCLILLNALDTWPVRLIAIIITVGSTYLIALLLNRFFKTNMRILGGMLELIYGPLLIIGVIACLAFFELWPVKVITMILWLVIMVILPSYINRYKE